MLISVLTVANQRIKVITTEVNKKSYHKKSNSRVQSLEQMLPSPRRPKGKEAEVQKKKKTHEEESCSSG